MTPLLLVKNLSVRYHGREVDGCAAIEDVSLEVASGEVVGIAGESGCGKTTLARAVMRLLDKDTARWSGSIRVHGQDLAALDERALQQVRGAEISLMSQEPSLALSPVLRAGEQIAEVLHAHKGWNWKKCCAEAVGWLGRVGLEPIARFFRAYPHELSGGQLQRVALAQALCCGPTLLIADEPTAALDARNQAAFIALLRRLKAEVRLSVLLVSHAPELHASLADRLLVMQRGRIVEEGAFAKLYSSPANAYTRTLMHRTEDTPKNGAFGLQDAIREPTAP